MQHGALIPLGRQLRSVRLSIRSTSAFGRATTRYQNHSVPSNASSRPRCLQYGVRYDANDAAAWSETIPVWPEEAQELREEPVDEGHVEPKSSSSSGAQQARAPTRHDHLTEALKRTPYTHALPARGSAAKRDLSHTNIRRKLIPRTSPTSTIQCPSDSQPSPDPPRRFSLIWLLAKYIRHVNRDPSQTPHPFSQPEEEYITSMGYSLEDISVWAGIVTAGPSSQAATRLLHRVTSSDHLSPPFNLLLYFLRRPYLSASALRQLIIAAQHIVEQRISDDQAPRLPENAVMILFVRLVRHAREVWPSVLGDIAALLTRALQATKINHKTPPLHQRSRLVYIYNAAMHLLSIPTGAQPFKDAAMQEAAIVRVLRSMFEYQPPLLIDRQGYRAVVRVQIAQSKTSSEQEWAELKALSWPPWKQERTAMDADITAENHGRSRASHTLQRMREAGYTPDTWAKVAQLYSGWDIDGTPTVQTRAIMGSSVAQYRTEHPIWAARIATTRTAQEAWAAYLAYEDTGLGPDAQVMFAIVRKLSEEDKRSRPPDPSLTTKRDTSRRARLLPGDRREVAPLPPSVHLYTYTRTPVPSVDNFFQQLIDRGVDVDPYTLVLAIENAVSLQQGVWYLRAGSRGEDNQRALLLEDPMPQLSAVPPPLFSAFIGLLCRFPNVNLSKVIANQSEISSLSSVQPKLLQGHELNPLHPLVHAVELLGRFRPTSPVPWTNILNAMSNTVTLTSMRFFFRNHQCRPAGEDPAGMFTRAKVSMVALSFVNHIVSVMRRNHVDINEIQLLHICQAVENMAVACWRLTKYKVKSALEQNPHLGSFKLDTTRDAYQAIEHASDTSKYIKDLLTELIGSVDQHVALATVTASSEDFALPQLLHCPSPVLLHAHIRALGWLGDYDGLLDLTRWMVAHQHKLGEQRKRDRNAEDLMSLSIQALRVFLERRWLPAQSSGDVPMSAEPASDAGRQDGGDALARLETPAPGEIVEEVERLVNSVDDWPSWPDEEDMANYCRRERFRELQKMYMA
ncbi:hypothetical protein Tdes44962_MAKER09258 [Teratosphaeria destructans]|uniref:Prefoldin subunit n=1 Tax=Teratosphaeria destructans TaxID=418781 RepID=A0A9W7W3A1_9PEZI|nr:hypothetical protein Tdes44962_MAKER09258 [Teratosphaeria destructans]